MKKIHDVLLLDEENLALAAKAEIDTVSDVIKEFRVLMQMYSAGISVVKTKLETLDEEFRAKYDYNPIHHIESRLKEPRSIFEKMRRMGLPPTLGGMKGGLTDIAGVRVVCNYIQDAEMIAELLLSQDDVSLIKKTDYIHNPKESGYRSLHIVIEVPIFLSDRTERVPVEIQIRTIAMDFWASLEHKMYLVGLLRDDLQRNLTSAVHLLSANCLQPHSKFFLHTPDISSCIILHVF